MPALTEPFALRCVRCMAEARGFARQCEHCGGIVDPQYYAPLLDDRRSEDADVLTRYAAVLPIVDRASARLPLPITPVVELDSVDGIRVFGKVEGLLPTGSTKDRLVAVSLPFMLENSVERFAFSSTGNTAIAYAHGLHLYPEFCARLYISTRVERASLGPVPPNLSIVVVNGDYARASVRVREHRERTGYESEGGFFNIGRREGAKLAYMEALDQLAERDSAPDVIIQAVASGLGIYAASRAVSDMRACGRLTRTPRLICAQQASCAPMVSAYRAEEQGQVRRSVLRSPVGIAPSLLLGDPFASYPYVAAVVRASGGRFVAVPEQEVTAVLSKHRDDTVPLGASAAVALASVRKVVRACNLAPGDVVLVMLTGGPNR
jgi:threonine synthase